MQQVTSPVPHSAAFERSSASFTAVLKMLRVHQWAKNALIFVPIVTAHAMTDAAVLAAAVVAFVAYSLCASAVYVLNDILDLSADRLHPTKSQRPFAAGHIRVRSGAAVIPILLGASVVVAAQLPVGFGAVLATYYGLTVVYSLHLKRVFLLDAIVLAGLYTLRIAAGHEATGLSYSPWLLGFSMFFFFSLALVKRFSELLAVRDHGGRSVTLGRGYERDDLDQLTQLGSSSATVAVLILALYINSDAVKPLYHHAWALWLMCPLLLYWIGRIWTLARNGRMHDDPIVFTLNDRVSYISGAIALLILVVARYDWSGT